MINYIFMYSIQFHQNPTQYANINKQYEQNTNKQQCSKVQTETKKK